MGLNIVVTGAAGFIGSHTVDHLLAAGQEVWGIDNFRSGKKANLVRALGNRGFVMHEFDILDTSRLHALVRTVQPDAIIHLAALVSVPESFADPVLNSRLNFEATRIVADVAVRFEVPRLVFASSAAVYGDPERIPILESDRKEPLSPYGAAKLASEQLLAEVAASSKVVVRCHRYFNVYGPRQDPRSPYSGVISIFCDHFQRGATPIVYGDGSQTRDFISVHDVARANTIAAVRNPLEIGTVNICTGVSTSVGELWSLITAESVNPLLPSHLESRPGDIQHSCGSTIRAQQELGFRAAVDISSGLKGLLAQSPFAGSQ